MSNGTPGSHPGATAWYPFWHFTTTDVSTVRAVIISGKARDERDFSTTSTSTSWLWPSADFVLPL
ncbi:MAG TPA: hypothetical protein QGG47_04155 [Acidobacteriota bacterium]|nr:hypothetical protein [Acidobacteriota bacterium]